MNILNELNNGMGVASILALIFCTVILIWNKWYRHK